MSQVSLIVPGIITEILTTGNLTVIPAALNVIGVVGTFGRGDLAKINTVGSIEEAISSLGTWDDSLTGMKALYQVFSNNKTIVKAVRVAGSSAAAASLALSNQTTTTTTSANSIGDTVVNVTSSSGMVVGETLIMGSVANARENAVILSIAGNAITLTKPLIKAYSSGATVVQANVTTTTNGAITASDTVIKVVRPSVFTVGQTVMIGSGGVISAAVEEKVIASIQATTITLTAGASNAYLSGASVSAVITPAAALTLTAKQSGSFGNLYTASVSPGSTTNTFKLTLTGDGINEVYDSQTSNATVAATINGLTPNLPGSNLVTAVAGSLLIVDIIGATNFTGGDNGAITSDGTPAVADNDRILYIGANGVSVLDGEEADIIILAGQSHPSSQASLDTYVQNRGDCVAIYGGYLGETVADLVIRASTGGILSTYPSAPCAALNSDRAIVTGPGLLFQQPLTGNTITLQGAYMAAAYAGVLSGLDPFRSPSHKNIRGILGLEKRFSETDVITLTLGRVSPISAVKGLGFMTRNGLTTSADPNFSQTCTRRLTDQIIQGLNIIFAPLVSEPNNADLAVALAADSDAFLGKLEEEGSQGGAALQNYTVNIHASGLDKLARQIFVDIAFLPNGPADYIRLRLTPNAAGLAISTPVSA